MVIIQDVTVHVKGVMACQLHEFRIY